ncbi:Zinc finger, RING/FYVE/PHD-type [Lasallia pustulata]|uniref:Zinc finger, RING/FYVE/PHD-type n=1 Tax=Lasallia pustulata TaxID=136370 RepID=A0A1W5D6W9_9LECA|nr:Zinc finger, RING/FYVE/PHD-type [Lasallia pustulata]
MLLWQQWCCSWKTSTPMSSLKRIRSCVGEEWTENPRPAKQAATDYQFSADVNSSRYTWDTPEAYDTSLLASDEAAVLCEPWVENITDKRGNPAQQTMFGDCPWDGREPPAGLDGYAHEGAHKEADPVIRGQFWNGFGAPPYPAPPATYPLSTPEAPDSATISEFSTPTHACFIKKDPPPTELCFGTIVDAQIAPFNGSKKHGSCLEAARRERSPLPMRHRAGATTVLSSTMEEVAILDTRHTHVLNTLRATASSLQLELLVSGDRAKRPHNGATRNNFTAEINVYGNTTDIASVSSILSDAGIFLQEPEQLDSSTIYRNPHVLSWEVQDVTPCFRRMLPSVEAEFEKAVEGILDEPEALPPHTDFLQDHRITSVLCSHQKSALQFMLSRESEILYSSCLTLWDHVVHSGRVMFTHKITKAETCERPSACRGGLLADEMGMGKTLTVLALIVHSLDQATKFAGAGDPTNYAKEHIQCPSRATLIVTPKSTLHTWESELERHIAPSTLKVLVYHGQGASRDLSEIIDNDLVVVTYETLLLKSRMLRKISWFRIVLDEAHWIRTLSTKKSAAAFELDAQRRWCLTGTPVQNKLEDLFALIRFLRFQPLDNVSTFRKYILTPLGKLDERGLENLRLMMKALAIRRTKGATGVSGRSEKLVPVELSPTERSRYTEIRDQAKQFLLESSTSGCSQPSHIILQTLLRLRQLCSHGHSNVIPGLDVKELPYNGMDSCNQCGIPIKTVFTLETNFRGQCGHQFCPDCYAQFTALYDGLSSFSAHACPICDSSSTLTGGTMDWASGIHTAADTHMVDAFEPQKPTTTSSKISTVISQLLEIDRRCRSDDGSGKSLVFSCWTTALDDLQRVLTDQGLPFVRIDGSCSLEQRRISINRFQSERDIKVMLLSIGSGSVGLNLTAASHVHIVEPQWNPMVEEQAAARVDRIGQTLPVVIYRYFVENSIETTIRAR